MLMWLILASVSEIKNITIYCLWLQHRNSCVAINSCSEQVDEQLCVFLLFPGTPLHLYASSLHEQPVPSYGDHSIQSMQEESRDVSDNIAVYVLHALWWKKLMNWYLNLWINFYTSRFCCRNVCVSALLWPLHVDRVAKKKYIRKFKNKQTECCI